MIGTDGTEKEKKMKRTQKWLSFAAGMLLILMLGAVSAADQEPRRRHAEAPSFIIDRREIPKQHTLLLDAGSQMIGVLLRRVRNDDLIIAHFSVSTSACFLKYLAVSQNGMDRVTTR